ncbi:hypothetical protein [Pseudaestuariivita rosea]|uniref:hypothetical protein n=1 Tax=Pseudaestuariivita rosea TaxID=2763263 RepID=UPI001ABADC6A|nr:hypothetical protein [Pseudaestuariivita rosea]
MATAVNGKEVLVFIDDGTRTMVEVPYQGDATYASGRTAEISVTKNGKHPYQTEAGETVTFSFEKERPVLAVHNRLRQVAESGEIIAAEYKDPKEGGEGRSGQAMVTLGNETTNVEGVVTTEVTLSFVDNTTHIVTPAPPAGP